MSIVPIYASLLAFLFFALSVRVIRQRGSLRVALGDQGHASLIRAIGVHANFAEYVPFTLLLLAFAEMQNLRAGFLHFLCVVLLLGRLSHAYGVSQAKEDLRFRVAGMLATFFVMIATALYLLFVSFSNYWLG